MTITKPSRRLTIWLTVTEEIERGPLRYQAESQGEARLAFFQVKSIVAICITLAVLWVADIVWNDGRYSDATGRTIVRLVEK